MVVGEKKKKKEKNNYSLGMSKTVCPDFGNLNF